MGSFGWGDVIAVIAVVVSLASVAVTARTSRAAEAAAAAAAKRQEHMAHSFDRLVAAAEEIAKASGHEHGGGVRADAPAAPQRQVKKPQWQVENPSEDHFLLRNLSSSTRHDVRLSPDPGQVDPSKDSQQPGGVDLAPLAAHSFVVGRPPDGGPERIFVTDAEHPAPVEVPVERWF